MAHDSVLLDKVLQFAARIIKLKKYLVAEKRETVISKQILRSATSIGANANEAIYGVSKADFISKMQISLKETAETEYWIRLLVMSEYITQNEGESLLSDCLEIKRILVSTLNSAKANQEIKDSYPLDKR
ncbi:MAG: four helix bundle protein [Oscillospiraceae bacterium]|nr:four helix bundle protein [Oscillospiraceae bacterium]